MMMMIYWALIYIYEYLFFELNLNYNYNMLHFLIIVCRNKFNDSLVNTITIINIRIVRNEGI